MAVDAAVRSQPEGLDNEVGLSAGVIFPRQGERVQSLSGLPQLVGTCAALAYEP